MGRESLEPHELVETEDFAREVRSRLSSRIAVTVAVLAVLASISSREAERYASESILDKNEAILAQARSSDDWAYRQAKSIKLRLQELGGHADDADHARSEIATSEADARVAEQQRDEANRRSAESFERHHRFAFGTSLLQIAIVLETVAAVLDRRWLWYAGIAAGAAGALACCNGWLGFF